MAQRRVACAWHLMCAMGRRGGSSVSGGDQVGQSLVEFSLILPLFVIVLMGLFEFAFAFNANLGINQASQNAALAASQAGNAGGSDCLILASVENDVQAPADRRNISEIQVQRTNPSGSNVFASNRYTRTGSTTCNVASGGTLTVPYTLVASGYPESQRCNVLAGCPTLAPPRMTVDTIGVQVEYRYSWSTPLGALRPLIGGSAAAGSGYTFTKRNVFRLEPVL